MEVTRDLVDITTIKVNTSLSIEERLIELVKQVGNPHHFLCCGYEVTVSYADTDLTMEKCVIGIF